MATEGIYHSQPGHGGCDDGSIRCETSSPPLPKTTLRTDRTGARIAVADEDMSFRFKDHKLGSNFKDPVPPADGSELMETSSREYQCNDDTPLPRPTSRTKKFQSFINFALNNYQSSM